MQLSRRGFIQSMIAGAVGLATYEPKNGLWVPAQPAIVASVDVDEQLEVNEIARLFAKEVGERLAGTKVMTLHEVVYQHTGNVGLLEIPGVGAGYVHGTGRVLYTAKMGGFRGVTLDRYVQAAAGHMGLRTINLVAPIGSDLRPGEAFAIEHDHMMIGLATDPESGVSVRILRHDVDRSGRLTSAEIGGAAWTPATSTLNRRYNHVFTPMTTGAGQTGRTLTTSGWSGGHKDEEG